MTYLKNIVLCVTHVFFCVFRRRSLVAIGTHDLDTIQGPFTYDAKPPAEICFQALNQKETLNAVQLFELYSVSFYFLTVFIIKE